MPNIPLPPLQARLQQQNMITPIVKGTPTPMDVIQHQALIDYAQRAQEGIKGMQDLTRSKQIAAEAQAQAEGAKQAQTQYKFYNDYVKMTMARTDIPESQKHGLIDMYGLIHGFKSGPEGSSVEPGNYAAPMIEELQKRYIGGNMTAEDFSKSATNLYPSFLYPPSPGSNNPQTPPAPPAPPLKPKVTTTTTTNGGDNSGSSDQGGVSGYGGDVGSD